MNGKMKVRYIRKEKTIEFTPGEMYEAYPCLDTPKILCFIDRHGEEYGYPASWFEVVEEDEKEGN